MEKNSPVSQFELVESIRFFASLVGTEGISEDIKVKANNYIERMVNAMENSVDKICGSASGLVI